MAVDFFLGKTVHLIGVGGIGMSAIAELLHTSGGVIVRGSDIAQSYITERLQKLGIEVKVGHDSGHVLGSDVIIRSSAITDGHVEVMSARAEGINILHRSEALALILERYKTVAITGTHGKSTTTALVGDVCVAGGLDPTVVNGAVMKQYGSNVRIGRTSLAVMESDESDESFLRLPADLACITNMDPDHLDYYGTPEKMEESYRQFIMKVVNIGECLICNDHGRLAELASTIGHSNITSYGIKTGADLQAVRVEATREGMLFDVKISHKLAAKANKDISLIENVELAVQGEHNVQNALASMGVGLILGVGVQNIKAAMKGFQGIGRRFTLIGTINGALVIDDYAHHPVEIRATLTVAKLRARSLNGRVIAVYQPHRYTRLASLMQESAKSFVDADIIILTEVYSANEAPIEGIDSQNLASQIRMLGQDVVSICADMEDLKCLLVQIAKEGDVVVMMGAGSISSWAKAVVNQGC